MSPDCYYWNDVKSYSRPVAWNGVAEQAPTSCLRTRVASRLGVRTVYASPPAASHQKAQGNTTWGTAANASGQRGTCYAMKEVEFSADT